MLRKLQMVKTAIQDRSNCLSHESTNVDEMDAENLDESGVVVRNESKGSSGRPLLHRCSKGSALKTRWMGKKSNVPARAPDITQLRANDYPSLWLKRR